MNDKEKAAKTEARSSSRKKVPRDINKLLAASKEELADWTPSYAISQPEDIDNEKRVLQFLQAETILPEDTLDKHWDQEPETKINLWTWFTSFWQKPLWGIAIAGAAVWMLFLVSDNLQRNGGSLIQDRTRIRRPIPPDSPSRKKSIKPLPRPEARRVISRRLPPSRKRELTPKGRKTPQTTQKIELHLSIPLANRKVKRLKNGDICQPNDSILFGFSVLEKPGFVYLLSEDNRAKVELLHGPSGKGSIKRPVGQFYLRSGERFLLYGFEPKQHTLVFVALKTSRLLSKKQVQALTNATSLLKNVQALKKSPGDKQAIHYDFMTLKVQRGIQTIPGRKPKKDKIPSK